AAAVSVDAIVDGVHFRLDDFAAPAIGRKALAAGLSDLAAMGAAPGEAYIVVAAPSELPDEVLLGIADGLAELASREGVTVAGGDLVASPVLVVSVTAIGYEPDGGRLITRAGARPGDVAAVTGELGGAAGALALMDPDGEPASIPPELRDAMLARQLEPTPRLREGLALAKAGATAMIDVSDGLGADAAHLARSSGCRLEIDLDRIPLAEGLEQVAGGQGAALELAASGGEDYELLVTLPPERIAEASEAVTEAGSKLTEIGYVAEGRGVALRLPGGGEIQPSGFDQRRGSLSGSG
ncbi:MAG: thiamine-monophosphate kinase, partial [Solirubrobacterales bacterium]|nr:thiamine-monophosphate kinase [Solirubrobacterales bacterium]